MTGGRYIQCMAKDKTIYTCSDCGGNEHSPWITDQRSTSVADERDRGTCL